ncbi:g10852 [Coccomyxa elongata]
MTVYASGAIQGGEEIPIRRKKRLDVGPTLDLSKEEAVRLQIEALKHNDTPYQDAGVELLYRFADIDPFTRSRYFGWSLDLGQFTRFQRVFHMMPYRLLLYHKECSYLSSLQVSEFEWRQRILVQGVSDEAVFEITMMQRFGGQYDGIYYTRHLKADPPWQPKLPDVLKYSH